MSGFSMSATCDEAAEQVTRRLGFDCHDVSPVVSVRSPFDLASWTMPVLELLIIAGAIFALVHAIRRFRGGDPINLALWFAPLVYLFVTEPPLYFPEWFGLDQQYGFIFAHRDLPGVVPAGVRVGAGDRSLQAERAPWIDRRRIRVPCVLRDLRPARPPAEVVGVE